MVGGGGGVRGWGGRKGKKKETEAETITCGLAGQAGQEAPEIGEQNLELFRESPKKCPTWVPLGPDFSKNLFWFSGQFMGGQPLSLKQWSKGRGKKNLSKKSRVCNQKFPPSPYSPANRAGLSRLQPRPP